MSSRKLLIIGAGGLGAEYAWVGEEINRVASYSGRRDGLWEILGFVDDDARKRGQSVRGHFVHGTLEEAASKFSASDIGFVISIGTNHIRERIASEVEKLGWTPEVLVHPSAVVADNAEIGAGSYLAPGVVICPGSRVGRYSIINTHASVGHDSILEDYVQVCPGARVSGGCRIAKGAFIGSNACLGPKTTVCERAVVGANSFVLRRVEPEAIVLGCPAIKVGQNKH